MSAIFRNALISVSDKTGLVDFVKPLVASGMRIVSSGGTAKFLREHGISVTDVKEQTGQPEVMGGRVKTLHPRIHMCLLGRDIPEDRELLKEQGLQMFDLVIVNLYPFEKTYMEQKKSDSILDSEMEAELIEQIDIGGPSLIRAASKNFSQITVVVDPSDYQKIGQRSMSLADRKLMAAKAFRHVSSYDSFIAQYLNPEPLQEMSWGARQVQELRYGENPQQRAWWYRNLGDTEGLASSEFLQGKALSYNNLLDVEAATQLVRALGSESAVVVKHNNPCGVAVRKNVLQSVELALKADAVSAFGGIVAVGQKVDQASAEAMAEFFLEVVVAPDFSSEALKVFSSKKNLRVLKWPKLLTASQDLEIKSLSGGLVLQERESLTSDSAQWQWQGPAGNSEIISDLLLAEKIAGQLKSNSIAIVENGVSLGLGMGQVNRVDSVKLAIERMQTKTSVKTPVLASDAFFPFADSIELIVKAGIKWIVQPGGSKRDEEVKTACAKHGISCAFTGVRHFKH